MIANLPYELAIRLAGLAKGEYPSDKTSHAGAFMSFPNSIVAIVKTPWNLR